MYKLFLLQKKIKSNCFLISCFHNLSWKAYENKLEMAYEHAINLFTIFIYSPNQSHKCLCQQINSNK